MPSVYTSLRRPRVCVTASSVQNGMYRPSGYSVIAIMLTKSHDNLMARVSFHWVKLTIGRIILIPD